MVEFVCRICGHDDYMDYRDAYCCAKCGSVFIDPLLFTLPNDRGFELVKDEFRKHKDVNCIKLPSRSTHKSAGYDFYSPIDFTIEPGQDFKLWTDVKAYMYDDEFLFLDNRSSIANKHNVIIKNIIPIIDADYYGNESTDGNIQIRLINNGNEPVLFKGCTQEASGSKIAQGIFVNYLKTRNDCPEEYIRKGGVGSTGK